MYYILNENIALRSWWFVPYAFYVKHDCLAHGLKKEEFECSLFATVGTISRKANS